MSGDERPTQPPGPKQGDAPDGDAGDGPANGTGGFKAGLHDVPDDGPRTPDVEVPTEEEAIRLAREAPESGKAKRLFAKGAELARDPRKAKMILDDAMVKARRHEGALGKAWEDLQTLASFVKDSVTGRYKPELTSLGLALGALLYFLSPLDVIPDFIVAIGYLDDAAILAFAVHRLRDELAKYRIWRDTLDIDPGNNAEPLPA